MKITHLEGCDKLITKEYLELKLAVFRLEIQREFPQIRREISEQFKWNMGMFGCSYATIILGCFFKP